VVLGDGRKLIVLSLLVVDVGRRRRLFLFGRVFVLFF
jgi:hypothetical protein